MIEAARSALVGLLAVFLVSMTIILGAAVLYAALSWALRIAGLA